MSRVDQRSHEHPHWVRAQGRCRSAYQRRECFASRRFFFFFFLLTVIIPSIAGGLHVVVFSVTVFGELDTLTGSVIPFHGEGCGAARTASRGCASGCYDRTPATLQTSKTNPPKGAQRDGYAVQTTATNDWRGHVHNCVFLRHVHDRRGGPSPGWDECPEVKRLDWPGCESGSREAHRDECTVTMLLGKLGWSAVLLPFSS